MPSLFARYSAFAVDLDGVVWRGEETLPEALTALRAILASHKGLLLLTNNASYTPSWVVDKLAREGVEIEPEVVLNSAKAAREWIKKEVLVGESAFVLGSREVEKQLNDLVEIVPVVRGNRAAMVLVARDTEFSYERLEVAANAVRSGAALAATNRDHVMPTESGLLPGTGALVAAVEIASEREALVLGKPYPPMMDAAIKALGPDGVLMVGDREDSDIGGARYAGWDSALVLSGVSNESAGRHSAADYVIQTLGDLLSDEPHTKLGPS